MTDQRMPGRNAPYKSDSNYHEGTTLSLSPPMYLHVPYFFPPNKHLTCFTAFCIYVGIHFYTADGPGPCHWPLVPGGLMVGFRTLTAAAQPQSLARNRSPPSSHCRSRPPEITSIYSFISFSFTLHVFLFCFALAQIFLLPYFQIISTPSHLGMS